MVAPLKVVACLEEPSVAVAEELQDSLVQQLRAELALVVLHISVEGRLERQLQA